MLSNSELSLSYLFQSGFTHLELKKYIYQWWMNPEKLWDEISDTIFPIEMTEERQRKIQEKMKKVDTQEIKIFLTEKNIQIITLDNPLYPQKLKSIWHAPAFLYVRGVLRTDLPSIGIVGSRKNTPYAERILKKIIPDIVWAWVWIISGWATGVDALAHKYALERNGYTLAVFGTGIDRCYPAGNKSLFESILAWWWALVSHFPLGTWPELYNFPIRNEIVAAISDGILIPEAALSSGTLITAQLALEHGRDVFAVPGDIDRSTSEWTNMLISTGQAKCVRCSEDILEEYFDVKSIGAGLTPIIKTSPQFSHELEKIIYDAIESWYSTIDDLLKHTNIEMTELLTHIAMIEIEWHITLDTMGKYQIT